MYITVRRPLVKSDASSPERPAGWPKDAPLLRDATGKLLTPFAETGRVEHMGRRWDGARRQWAHHFFLDQPEGKTLAADGWRRADEWTPAQHRPGDLYRGMGEGGYGAFLRDKQIATSHKGQDWFNTGGATYYTPDPQYALRYAKDPTEAGREVTTDRSRYLLHVRPSPNHPFTQHNNVRDGAMEAATHKPVPASAVRTVYELRQHHPESGQFTIHETGDGRGELTFGPRVKGPQMLIREIPHPFKAKAVAKSAEAPAGGGEWQHLADWTPEGHKSGDIYRGIGHGGYQAFLRDGHLAAHGKGGDAFRTGGATYYATDPWNALEYATRPTDLGHHATAERPRYLLHVRPDGTVPLVGQKNGSRTTKVPIPARMVHAAYEIAPHPDGSGLGIRRAGAPVTKSDEAGEPIKHNPAHAKFAGLAAEARQHDTFRSFERNYSGAGQQGQYWHITDDPHFTINPQHHPSDLSSIASGPSAERGLMVTNSPDFWRHTFPSRQHVAEIDLSGMREGEHYTNVNRGFGHEVFIHAPELARVKRVLPLKQGIAAARHYNEKTIPQNPEDLRAFWERARGLGKSEYTERPQATQPPPRTPPPPVTSQSPQENPYEHTFHPIQVAPTAQPIQPVNTRDELFSRAALAQHEFHDLLNRGKGLDAHMGMAVFHPGEKPEPEHYQQPGGFIQFGNLKGQARAEQKVNADYGGNWNRLGDVVRGSVAVDSLGDVGKVANYLHQSGVEVAGLKNRLARPTPAGYRDGLMHLRMPSGVLAELQVHLKPVLAAKQAGHKPYETMRDIEAKYSGHDEDAPLDPEDYRAYYGALGQSRDIYHRAWEQAGGKEVAPLPEDTMMYYGNRRGRKGQPEQAPPVDPDTYAGMAKSDDPHQTTGEGHQHFVVDHHTIVRWVPGVGPQKETPRGWKPYRELVKFAHEAMPITPEEASRIRGGWVNRRRPRDDEE